MGFFKIALFVACFAASQFVFADDCAKGEVLWCSSFKQAAKCSAFSHCKNTVWKNEMPTEDPSEVCQFCETIVKDVVSMLSQNKSMEFIQDFLMTACNLIPSTKLLPSARLLSRRVCHILSSSSRNEWIPRSSAASSDSARISSTVRRRHLMIIFLSRRARIRRSSPWKEYVRIASIFVNKTRENFLSKETEKKVLNFVENVVCNFFLIGRAKCKETADKYVPQFFDSLRKNFDPKKICAIFCKKNEHSNVDQKFPDTACMGCRFIAGELLGKLADPKFQKTMVDFSLTHVCPLFGNASEECSILIKNYGASTLEMIAKNVDAKQICHMLGVCDSLVEIKSEDLKLGADKCETCQIIAQYLEALLETDAVVVQIEKFLSKGCHLLPESVHTTCQALVEEYGNLIIHYVAHIFSPRGICQFLNLCQEVSEGQHHKCISGPEFWCSSPKNAELCLAEDYCKKFFWI